MNILITNAQLRKSLTLVRSLGQNNFKIFSSEITLITPVTFSKYCYKAFKYPSPKDKLKFKNWLFTIIDKFNIDIFIPMDDDILESTFDYWDELNKKVLFPYKSSIKYKTATDKYKSTQLANDSGLICPKTKYPNSLKEALELKESLVYPVIIKPRISSGSRGIRIIKNKYDFEKIYNYINSIYPLPIIQEYIEQGPRYDVCLLVNNNSEIIASFVQKELRHFPLRMGPSTLQESIYMPDLINKCKNLIKNLSWFGIIEIEFMLDKKDNKLKFMEINPRFWNSLNTSIISGVDFPILLVDLLKNTKKNTEEINYIKGIKSRTLLPNDILHFIFSRNKFNLNPPFISSNKNKLYDDIISKKDFFPVLGFLLSVLMYIPNIKMWKSMFKR
jgi:predicted ATP-grasp superfamily ATP-dependent carboligase